MHADVDMKYKKISNDRVRSVKRLQWTTVYKTDVVSRSPRL